MQGDASALSAAAQRGLALFESSRLGCTHCYGGPLQSSAVDPEAPQLRFEKNGLHAAYPPGGGGLYELISDPWQP